MTAKHMRNIYIVYSPVTRYTRYANLPVCHYHRLIHRILAKKFIISRRRNARKGKQHQFYSSLRALRLCENMIAVAPLNRINQINCATFTWCAVFLSRDGDVTNTTIIITYADKNLIFYNRVFCAPEFHCVIWFIRDSGKQDQLDA